MKLPVNPEAAPPPDIQGFNSSPGTGQELLPMTCRQRFKVLGFNRGALIIRIGFWVTLTITIIKSPQNSIGTY